MLCACCPPTILGDFYRIPEKPPKSSADKMQRACESKDQILKKIRTLYSDRENSLNIKFWAGHSWGIRDPDVGIAQTKTLCNWPFSVLLDREWPGCPAILVGTSRIWKNFMQENFGLIFRTLQKGTAGRGRELTTLYFRVFLNLCRENLNGGLANGGLKVLVHNCPRLPTIQLL